MFVQSLSDKLADSIDELAKLLDCLHRFPQQMRKLYFERIQGLRQQMTSLKTSLKESTALQTERQYNQLFLVLNTLKGQVQDQTNLLANKENRSINCSQITRSRKNTHDDALRLLAEKEEEIGQLKLTLFEKEELISLTFEELRDFKRDCRVLDQQNKMLKVDVVTLEQELCAANQQWRTVENEATDLRLENQELQRQVRLDGEALDRFSSDLMIAKGRLQHFQRLADTSMMKTSLVEENMQRVQQEAAFLNENYRAREEQDIRREKAFEQLKLNLKLKDGIVSELAKQNEKGKEEIEALEGELTQMQKANFQVRMENKKLRQQYDQVMREGTWRSDELRLREMEKNQEMEDLEAKFMEVYNQHSASQEMLQLQRGQVSDLVSLLSTARGSLNELSLKYEELQQQNTTLKEQISTVNCSVDRLNSQIKEKEAKTEELSLLLKEIQTENNNNLLCIETLEGKAKHNQRNRLLLENQQLQLASEIASTKRTVFHLQESSRSSARTLLQFKKRLFRAKLEVVHDIRSQISQ